MTDKQIIIDGVNVSGCPFFEDERKLLNPAGQELNFKNICSLSFYNFTDFDKDFLCNQSPNCYYKQLKRKEDLLNDIEKVIEPYQTEIEAEAFSLPTAVESILERKEQECETLASQLDFEVQKKECLEQECERLKKEVEFYTTPVKLGDYKHITLIIEELDQLKQAIEKIKELIQKEIADCEHCDDCASCEYNCCIKQILQICDEVTECENQ